MKKGRKVVNILQYNLMEKIRPSYGLSLIHLRIYISIYFRLFYVMGDPCIQKIKKPGRC